MAARCTGEAAEDLKQTCREILGEKLDALEGKGQGGFHDLTQREMAALRILFGTYPEMGAFLGLKASGSLNCAFKQRGIGGKRECYDMLGLDVPAVDSSLHKRPRKAPAVDPDTGLESDIAQRLHRMLKGQNKQYTLKQLSERLDRSEATIRAGLDEIAQAGIVVRVDENDASPSASVLTTATPVVSDYDLPGHDMSTVLLGAISDTHLESLCCARGELEWAYDWFVREGVTAVLHAGDLSDGPGSKGFDGHDLEVLPELQTQWACAKYILDQYPQRDGVKTYFIESSKSHAGWCFKHTGFSIGDAISRGFVYPSLGPFGEGRQWVAGRDDMVYLGADEENVWVGPEYRTKITLHHPDGGSAYASSYQPQKWVESLAGGSKPHLAILGHYHKSNYFRPRDVHVVCPGCLCWQTPFMRRKRLAAEVAAWLIELQIDTGGSIHELRIMPHPFYPPEQAKRVRVDL